MNPDLSQRLRRELTPDIERLSDLIDRDLNHWLIDP